MFLLHQPTHRMLVRHHERIGHLFVPNLRARLPSETGGFLVRTNALGFRSDVDYAQEKGDRPRIVFLGDSYLAGDNIGNGERFSEAIGEALDAEVYNYGVSGSGLDQALLIFEEFAADVAADLVVLAPSVDTIDRIQVSHREAVDRVTRRRVLVPKPHFVLEGGELSLRGVPVPRERPDAGGVDPRPAAGAPTSEGLRDRLVSWYRSSARTRGVRRLARERLGPARSLAYRLSGTQPYADYRSASSDGWQLLRAIAERICERAEPLPVLVVPIPTYPFLLHGARPLYSELYASLADADRGIHVLDITTPLARAPWGERAELTFREDPHFSAEGHRKVASMVVDEIRRKALLPERARPEAPARSKPRGKPAKKPVRILGISAFYHDSAACLVEDGRIVAAAAEERFSRVKNDRRFPKSACNYCLEEGEIEPADLDAVVYYDNASLTFERLMHSQCAAGEEGREVWLRTLPSWVRYKLHLPQLIRKDLHYDGLLLQELHHRSHAASAFFPSPFERAAILTVDGVGEWATASIGRGDGSQLELLREMRFPSSLGLLYSAFTQFTGFKVNSGEYKMMGLAPYGRPRFVDRILGELVHLKEDGSLELDLEHFGFLSGRTMTNDRFAELFEGPARHPEARITQREMDLARSVQAVVEEAVLRMARHAHDLTGERNLCLAGGVALNCVANGRLLREGPFEDVWIQPAAGDAGCALGAALDAYHGYFDGPRALGARPLQGGSYWGPEYSRDELAAFLDTHGYPAEELAPDARATRIAELLRDGKVVGHFSGRLEFGPRALGARSILGDCRNRDMQATLNLRIKYRESFRPFAPSVLASRVSDYFELDRESPYMLLVAPVREERRLPFEQGDREDLLEVVREPRSDIPAVTHVDYSARVQTVVREDHPAYHDVIGAFDELTGTPVIINTSFNVRGEPIVCTPEDAYRCFMRTEMNVLALGNFLLFKEQQPPWPEKTGGHLENEDVDIELGELDDPIVDDLARLFDTGLVPIARELRSKHALQLAPELEKTPSAWSEFQNAHDRVSIFELPRALDEPRPDPAALGHAITRYWRPGEATERLRPLVVELIRLGLRHPIEEALEEEVEDAVYVMY